MQLTIKHAAFEPSLELPAVQELTGLDERKKSMTLEDDDLPDIAALVAEVPLRLLSDIDLRTYEVVSKKIAKVPVLVGNHAMLGFERPVVKIDQIQVYANVD